MSIINNAIKPLMQSCHYPIKEVKELSPLIPQGKRNFVIRGRIYVTVDDSSWSAYIFPTLHSVPSKIWFIFGSASYQVSHIDGITIGHDEISCIDDEYGKKFLVWLSFILQPERDDLYKNYNDTKSLTTWYSWGSVLQGLSVYPVMKDSELWKVTLMCPYGKIYANDDPYISNIRWGVEKVSFPDAKKVLSDEEVHRILEKKYYYEDSEGHIATSPYKYYYPKVIRQSIKPITHIRFPKEKLWETIRITHDVVLSDDNYLPKKTHIKNKKIDYSKIENIGKGVI